MTLLEVKKQVLAMLEEENTAGVATDPDILAKINYAINLVQMELAQIKRIRSKATFTYSTTYEFTLPTGFYQVDKISCPYEIYDGKILLDTEETSIDMYYFKYPTVITSSTVDTTALEVSPDCLNALIYGVAADITKGDPSDIYKDYRDRYMELKNELRVADSSPMITVDTTNAINDTLSSEF